MTRKKKIGMLDHIINSIKDKWDKAGVRDLVYLISYLAAVAVTYKTLMAGQALIVQINPIRWITGTVPTKEELEKLDPDTLLTSFVAAYIILKIDAQDIASAVGKIKTVAKGVIK